MTDPDLTVSYLGLALRTPLVVGAAAPLSRDLDQLIALEQAGAAAVVLHSLFEEQIEREQLALHQLALQGVDSYGEALTYLPDRCLEHGGHRIYLEQISRARARLAIPVIASLNGVRPGSWLRFARQIEAAGADAIELNIFSLPTDPALSSEAIETRIEEIVREVRAEVALPLAVKLGPFFTNFRAMASRMAAAGADALVLFNRFYQPDIEIETLEIRPNLLLSSSHDLRLPLRWIALLHGHLSLDLAASGGVQRGTDVVRLLMAGASVTQVVAALLRHGPQRLAGMERELGLWLRDHGYGSARELVGCMSQQRCADPAAYERAQYLQALETFTPAPGLPESVW